MKKHIYYLYMEDWLINLEGGVSTMLAEEIEQVWCLILKYCDAVLENKLIISYTHKKFLSYHIVNLLV